MANAIEMIVSKEAQKQLDDLNKGLKKTHEEIVRISGMSLDLFNGRSPRNPQGMNQAITDMQRIEAASNRLAERIEIDRQRERLAELRLARDRERAFDRAEQQMQREAARVAAAENMYNRTQRQLNQVTQAYNDLSLRRERYNNLTEQEERRLQTLQRVTERYNQTLRGVDASIGRHTRNVGNYASAFNPLSNSINQITREAPAFANSMQTGFMAISNNLPIFFDAISNTRREIAAMRAEGQQVPGLFRQLTSSLFSWGTALSVGVTLLTVYGKELVEAFSGANKLQETIDKHKKSVSEAGTEYIDNAEKLKYLKGIVNDTTISEEKRQNALDQLKEDIPQISKATLDQANSLKEVNKWTDIYIENAIHQAKANAFIQLSTEKLKQSYENQNKPLKESVKWYEDLWNRVKTFNNIGATAARNVVTATKNREEENKTLLEQSEQLKELARTELELIKVFDKSGKAAKKRTQELSFAEIESIYKLRTAQLELQKAEREGRANNEEILLNDRLQARKEFSEKSIDLLDLQIQYERDVLTLKYKEDLKENNEAYKKREISAKQFQKNLADIQNRYDNELDENNLQSSIKWQELLKEDQEFYKKIQLEKRKFSQDTDKLILESEKNKFKKISEDESKALKTRQNAYLEYIKLARKELDIAKIRELANANSDEEINNIIQKYKGLNEQLDAQESPWQKARKEFEKYIESLSSGAVEKALEKIGLSSLKMFTDIDKNGQTTFTKLLQLANGTKEKMAVIFQALGDVFQDVMALVNQSQQAQFDAQLSRLEQQKEIAIQFAGDSATAREEIERQYEEKRKQIERQRAEQEKRSAIFNAVIDTAQGVVAALATANIPLAVLIGALGSAQVAFIASQPIPAYAEGTLNHSGGAMLINDGKGSNFTETVVTPDGKMKQYKGRNVVVDAPKGTKVFNHDQWNEQLNNILKSAGVISPSFMNFGQQQNNVITADQLENIMSKQNNNSTSFDLQIDENGFRKMINKNGMQREVLNSRLRTKGRNV